MHFGLLLTRNIQYFQISIYRKELKYFFALVIDTATYMVNVIVVKCVSHAHAFERANFKLLAQKRILLCYL